MKTINLNINLSAWKHGIRSAEKYQLLYDNKLTDLHPELLDKLVVFDYPLNNSFELDPSFSEVPTLEKFIDFVIKSYEEIYKYTPNNVWGHGFADLFLEGITERKGKLELIMGS